MLLVAGYWLPDGCIKILRKNYNVYYEIILYY
jgi:hypothetical protein